MRLQACDEVPPMDGEGVPWHTEKDTQKHCTNVDPIKDSGTIPIVKRLPWSSNVLTESLRLLLIEDS